MQAVSKTSLDIPYWNFRIYTKISIHFSDCHTPCRGDKNKICGGTNRISVFGPPPGTPAFAHRGVTQKCEPWCLTADVESLSVSKVCGSNITWKFWP
jgi:hypothetical protein